MHRLYDWLIIYAKVERVSLGMKIKGLDALRVFTAFSIMLYHYFFIGVIQGFYSEKVFLTIAFWGELGVDIFFLLGGFLILQLTNGKHVGDFICSRLKRIYPPFVVAGGLTVIIGALMPNTRIRHINR